ncbi:MAG: hypothetical protein EOO97_01015 [Pedobacter sp.]|nr:MAG: hypothetical protein EOO97_01015 [Pedobacter sp.]
MTYAKRTFVLILTALALSGCSYKFNGATIPAEMKTVHVQFFENNAQLVVPYLSQEFTEALKTRIRNQTRLNIVPSEGQAIFEGRITNYSITPVAIQDNQRPVAGATRMTITVTVKYTNTFDQKASFEQSFERFKNFTLVGQSLQSVEQQLIKDINAMLTEDIFNRAFSQW